MNPKTRCTRTRPRARPLRSPGRAAPRTAGSAALFALLMAAGAACEPPEERERPAQPTVGTPEPPDDLADPMTQKGAALAYASELEFAEDAVHYFAWDKQHLDLVTTDAEGRRQVTRGPLGTIWPQVDSHTNSREHLERGRILARIELDAPYPKLGLPAGVSYVWVNEVSASGEGERAAPQGGAQDTLLYRAVIVPEDPDTAPVEREVDYIKHDTAGPRVGLALARWTWSADDENAWFTCRDRGCCEIK